MDDKDKAQAALQNDWALQLGFYRHYRDPAAEYIVYSFSLMEVSLLPLVSYYSCTKRTRWTRSTAVFFARVGRAQRFEYLRPASDADLLMALGR